MKANAKAHEHRAAPDPGGAPSALPWGGSGAARRCRRAGIAAIAAALSSLMLTSPSLAGASLVDKTMLACGKALEFGPNLKSTLSSFGWIEFSAPLSKRFSRLAHDGYGLLFSLDPASEMDWNEVLETGKSFTNHHLEMLQRGDAWGFVDTQNPKAVLLVIGSTKNGKIDLECIYAGPSSEQSDKMLDELKERYKQLGITQMHSEAHLAYGELNSEIGSPTRSAVLSIQIAKYLEPMNGIWGRPARVETAFSIRKQSKK